VAALLAVFVATGVDQRFTGDITLPVTGSLTTRPTLVDVVCVGAIRIAGTFTLLEAIVSAGNVFACITTTRADGVAVARAVDFHVQVTAPAAFRVKFGRTG
jgi:hypothetical protein